MSYEYTGPGIDQEYTPPKSKNKRNCCLFAAGGCGCLTVVMILLCVVIYYVAGGVFYAGVKNQVVLDALQEYVQDNGEYPPAYSVDEDGNPLHSWRVLILPYFDEDAYSIFFRGMRPSEIYEQIRLDEPWDSEHNRQFHTLMPQCYMNPGTKDDRRTNLQMVVGSQCLSDGPNYRTIKQVNAVGHPVVLFVEASPAVEWMKPQDLSYDDLIKNGIVSGNDGVPGLVCPHSMFGVHVGVTALSDRETFFYSKETKKGQQKAGRSSVSLEFLKECSTLDTGFETEDESDDLPPDVPFL